MIYIGMDIRSKRFVIHAIDRKKQVVCKEEIAASRQALRGLIRRLGREPKLVVFEAGNQMKWIAQTLKKIEGVELHVVHPNELKWISQSSGKTDKVDARKMAELARGDLRPRRVHVVEGPIRPLRELLSARQALQSKRVALINGIRAMLLQEGVSLPEKFFGRSDWRERLSRAAVTETLHGRMTMNKTKQHLAAWALPFSVCALSASGALAKEEESLPGGALFLSPSSPMGRIARTTRT